MPYLNVDLHMHTNASFDSNDSTVAKLKMAEKVGLDIIAITDHNSIDNALKAQEIVPKLRVKLKVIVGEEISTDKGEVIGLFLEKFIKPGKLQTVIENIKSQGGIIYLPHPFKRSEVTKTNFIKDIDIIEVWNARSSYEQNYKALIFALQQGKLMACGSDSHIISELGRCRMIVDTITSVKDSLSVEMFLNLIRNASKIKIIGTNRNFIKLECKSQFIKCLKRRTVSPIKYLMRYLPFQLICNKNNPSGITILLEKNGDRFDVKLGASDA